MSSILGVAGTAGIVAGGVLAAKLTEKLADTLADTTIHGTIQTIKAAWDSNAPTSYVRAAAPTKVEPFVMVDESVVGQPYTKDVMVALQRIFSCNYLLAQAAQNQIGGITISKRLDRFSPDRSLDIASRHFLSMESTDSLPIGVGPMAAESYALSLPIPGAPVGRDRYGDLAEYVNGPIKPYLTDTSDELEDDVLVASLLDTLSEESDKDDGDRSQRDNKDRNSSRGRRDRDDDKRRPTTDRELTTGSLGRTVDVVVNETMSLAVGQIVDVKIVHEDKVATMPIHIRMRPITVSSPVVAGTFALQGSSYKIGDRIRAFRVGEIDWKDLVFQTDAIREYRKLAKQDKNKFFRQTYERANKNVLSHLLTGKSSVGQMSSIILTSKDTVQEFEYKTGQSLNDYHTRQAIMEDSLTMMIAVIDTDYETLTIYLDSIDSGSTYFISDLRARGKNDGNDMSPLLNSLLEGRIPGRL